MRVAASLMHWMEALNLVGATTISHRDC
jgi:hypothetical protein